MWQSACLQEACGLKRLPNAFVLVKVPFQDSEKSTVKDRPHPGRPRKTTRREDNYIVTSSRRNRFMSSTRIAGLVRNATGSRLCARTVRNRLRAARLRGRRSYVGVPLKRDHRRDKGTSSMDKTAVEPSCLYGRIPIQFEICGWNNTCMAERRRTDGSRLRHRA